MAIDINKLKAAQDRIDKLKGGKNLKMIDNTEMAREMQKKSVEARNRNKARIAGLKSFMEDFEKTGLELGDKSPQGVDMLNFLMMKAFHDEDFELAGSYAEKIAQYQTPKKASVHQTNTDVDLKDLSDEEFNRLKEELDG